MVQGKSNGQGAGAKALGWECGLGAGGSFREAREEESHEGPGSHRGFEGASWDLGGPGAFGRREGLCGSHVHRIPPAVRLRLGEGQG